MIFDRNAFYIRNYGICLYSTNYDKWPETCSHYWNRLDFYSIKGGKIPANEEMQITSNLISKRVRGGDGDIRFLVSGYDYDTWETTKICEGTYHYIWD
jgi:hypothetical protein